MNEGRQYRILGAVGRGGFGTVYKAALEGEGGFTKSVALKVLNADVAGVEEVAQRMRDEARVLGLVRHRALVQVDGLVLLDGRWTIVMEWVEGADLSHALAGRPVPQGPALEITAEVASALRVAYEQLGPDGRPLCMLHRDLKPSNLKLTAAGEVKVLDFGTARAEFSGREAKTQMLAFGTLDYMSPERLSFEDSPAGDVYALGCVLFEMLVGKAFGRTTAKAERHNAKRQRAVEEVVAAGVHEGIAALLRDMIAFEPEDRPSSRDVERACRELRGASGGPWLSDWAAEVVPPLLQATPADISDGLTGAVLRESSGGHRLPIEPTGETSWVARAPEPVAPPILTPAPPVLVATAAPPRARRGSRWALFGAAGLAVLVLGMAVVGVGAFALLQRTHEPRALHVPAPEVEVPPAVVAVVERPADTGLVVAAPEPVLEQGAPSPAPAPKPAAPAPKPAPRPQAAAGGRWSAQGDAEGVELVGSAGRFGPGPVPAGSYAVEATFAGRGTVTSGSVEVASGGSVVVDCRRAFAWCTVR